jgi:hypothetical protein
MADSVPQVVVQPQQQAPVEKISEPDTASKSRKKNP